MVGNVASTFKQNLTARVHWLEFTTRAPLDVVIAEVVKAACFYAGMNPGQLLQALPKGGNGYERQFLGWYGTRIQYSPNREDIHVILPGEACERSCTLRLFKLVEDMPTITVTRIDLALDGVTDLRGRAINPKWLYQMRRRHPEKVKTWAKGDSNALHLNDKANKKGSTWVCGTRNSERHMRTYDYRGFTRMELECRGGRAERIGEYMTGRKHQTLPQIVVGLIRDFVDFVESYSNKAMAKLQDWWQAVVDNVNEIELPAPKDEPTLIKGWEWLKKQVAPYAAMLTKATGGDVEWAFRLIQIGEQKLNAKHDHMIHQAGGVGAWSP